MSTPTEPWRPSSLLSGSSARAASCSATPRAGNRVAAARATRDNATAPTTSGAGRLPEKPRDAGSARVRQSSTAVGSPTGGTSNRSSPRWSRSQQQQANSSYVKQPRPNHPSQRSTDRRQVGGQTVLDKCGTSV